MRSVSKGWEQSRQIAFKLYQKNRSRTTSGRTPYLTSLRLLFATYLTPPFPTDFTPS